MTANDIKYAKNDTRFKAIYQDYDWCYQKFITEGLNHNDMAVEANCSKRAIKKWCSEKHGLTQKYRQKNKKFSNEQIDLIIGSLLGDGHIDKRETQPVFIVSHANNQKDYLYWKYNILKDLCNKSPSFIKEKNVYFNTTKSTHKCQSSHRICTRIYDEFKKYRNMDIRDLTLSLNELSFSIFMLDDGHRSRSNWSICVADFLENDKINFITYVKNKFNLDGIIQNYDSRYIQFDSKSSQIIDFIILKNIPNNLDVIRDKIIENKNLSSVHKSKIIKELENDILPCS